MRARNLWYKSAIIYEIDVRTFRDSNADGWGDFQGLISKLDYLTSLGVTCIWLKPFSPSPHRDGGYDIVDHYAVDPRIGTMGDFVDFMEEAASRGLAVITDLVVNHTSSDHPWFVESSSSRQSPMRDFYVWRDEPLPPERSPERITFSGDDTSVWTLHDSGQYYLHRFYPHQPDLNNANPRVREEVLKILAFYLRMGVAGFRVDAAPYIAEKAAEAEQFNGPHEYLQLLRQFIVERRPDAVFMAEADVEPEGLDEYFGSGDEMNLLLNFMLSQYLFLALVEEDATSLHDLVDLLPAPPTAGQYANFLRNHDELDMERLTQDQRRKVFDALAPDDNMRVYGRGIRRRVAPMLDGDDAQIRLAHSLLFSMPGTPVIYYGDELGMGDDLSLPERQSVRTPMQWSSEQNGGFSEAPVDDLYLRPTAGGPFGFKAVNVADQTARAESMLNWMRRLISTRKEMHAMAVGEWDLMKTGDPAVLGIRYQSDTEVAVVYHNLSSQERSVDGTDHGDLAYLYEVFADADYESPEPGPPLRINPHGYRWLNGRRRQAAEPGHVSEAR